MKYRYDFHIHSALSPCAEEEMTPNNIVNMAKLSGLDLIAVTDHNATGNLQALSRCAEKKQILFVPGIEVESAEEVHISCLFPSVESAMEMGELVRNHLLPMRNEEKIFGTQLLFDEEDLIIGTEKQMLLFSTDFAAEEVFDAAETLGGCAYFSHVDRDSYSVLSVLGTLPPNLETGVVELSDTDRGRSFAADREDLKGKLFLFGSDSHRLEEMGRGAGEIELPLEKDDLTVRNVIDWLRRVRARGQNG